MGANTKIEWTWRPRTDGTMAPGYTFNPWRGCTKVSAGCKFCYADTLSQRNPKTLGIWGPRGTRVVAAENYWKQPLKWNNEAAAMGERRAVFCASLADVFEGPETMPAEAWPVVEAARVRLWNLITQTPRLDWLLLTKRPENIHRFWPFDVPAGYPNAWDNIWIGTSVENQAAADERIPHLLRVPARVRFLSCEPLLGPVDLRNVKGLGDALYHCEVCGQTGIDPGEPVGIEKGGVCPECSGLKAVDWIIAGGESGPGARPMHPAWARGLRDQAQAAGVAYFHKQNGEHLLTPDGFVRVGKRAAGRLLDGREWSELPS